MRLPSDYKIQIKWFGVPRLYWLIGIFVVVFTGAIKMASETKPFVNPKIAAEPYVWPRGCEKRVYKQFDNISRNCLIPKYYIGDGQKWGWKRNSKWPYYYRVGNDAVLVTNIISGQVLSEKNSISEFIKDVFVAGYYK